MEGMCVKTIGLLGGMSWESTVTYYKLINEFVNKHLGRLHSAKCLLNSVDFEEIEACQAKGEWDKSGEILAEAAYNLEKAGADFIIICTNTMHKVVGQIQSKITIPVLHIAEATAEELAKNNIKKVALLGTKYTMQQDFYQERITEKGIDVIIPDGEDIEIINSTIYHELCRGIKAEKSKKEFLRIMGLLEDRGAEGIILGCTEIGLLVNQEDTKIPLYDTTYIHALKAALYSMGKEEVNKV
jgi:aspartate racemase